MKKLSVIIADKNIGTDNGNPTSVGLDDSGGAMGVLRTHGLGPLVSSMLMRAVDHKLG